MDEGVCHSSKTRVSLLQILLDDGKLIGETEDDKLTIGNYIQLTYKAKSQAITFSCGLKVLNKAQWRKKFMYLTPIFEREALSLSVI